MRKNIRTEPYTLAKTQIVREIPCWRSNSANNELIINGGIKIKIKNKRRKKKSKCTKYKFTFNWLVTHEHTQRTACGPPVWMCFCCCYWCAYLIQRIFFRIVVLQHYWCGCYELLARFSDTRVLYLKMFTYIIDLFFLLFGPVLSSTYSVLPCNTNKNMERKKRQKRKSTQLVSQLTLNKCPYSRRHNRNVQ